MASHQCHVTVNLEAGSQNYTSVHHSWNLTLSDCLTTGERYLHSWKGSPTAPMLHLFIASFWCRRKMSNRLSYIPAYVKLYTILYMIEWSYFLLISLRCRIRPWCRFRFLWTPLLPLLIYLCIPPLHFNRLQARFYKIQTQNFVILSTGTQLCLEILFLNVCT